MYKFGSLAHPNQNQHKMTKVRNCCADRLFFMSNIRGIVIHATGMLYLPASD